MQILHKQFLMRKDVARATGTAREVIRLRNSKLWRRFFHPPCVVDASRPLTLWSHLCRDLRRAYWQGPRLFCEFTVRSMGLCGVAARIPRRSALRTL